MATTSAKVIDLFASRSKEVKTNSHRPANTRSGLSSLPEHVRKEIMQAKNRNRDRD